MTEQLANQQSTTIALPVADRRTTFAFDAEGLGFILSAILPKTESPSR